MRVVALRHAKEENPALRNASWIAGMCRSHPASVRSTADFAIDTDTGVSTTGTLPRPHIK